MKPFAAVPVFLLLIASGTAQVSRLEFFGGYQFLHAGSFDGEGNSVNTNGWNTSATVNVREYLGLTADFSGNYKTESIVSSGLTGTAAVRIYTYTFGPAVSTNSGDIKLFAHALFGGAHVRPTGCVIFSGSPDECGSGSANGFSLMIGGGVDVRAGKSVAVRPVQCDWVRLPSQFGAQNDNVRISAGLVFRF
jgi:hypothetical protein